MADVSPTGENLGDELAEILREARLRTVFQPIVELESRAVVAYEALTRGPFGSALEHPDALFAAARTEGRLAELDSACRVEAFRTAFAAGLDTPRGLFVNSEPEALALLATDVRPTTPAMVLEITEREITGDPAQLLRSIDHVRDLGWSVALDDVGADSASIALLALIRPEVIKLDLGLVRDMPNQHIAKIMNAITAHSESTGAIIVAEGIETERHLDNARAMGATLGQGWLFGKPDDLPTPLPTITGLPSPVETLTEPAGSTPFTIAASKRVARAYSRDLLAEISTHLEARALAAGDTAVVLSTFQRAANFSGEVAARYRELSETVALAAVLGTGLEPDASMGRLHMSSIGDEDALQNEWSVAVLTPDFAALLAARELPQSAGDDKKAQFEFVLTHDRAITIAAARSLMERL
ncbi:sensor domain-containing phosphodiesterase [Subtercola endophyticus]|uniref:sensor domain-containing phosphodiesterase n=1 Tax=Subtercola endophyticus TaxID=2895559 RepID=UPI001E45C276|nr:EAL domain-containing protein [Subtercola endophyticus]UFS60134.1 EAL domain-containing protein [Subtercola endophyticus]